MMQLRQLRGSLVRLFGLFTRTRREREFAEELASHLAFHIEDNVRAGMSPEEARRRALIKLGGVTLTQELYREQRGLPMLETLLQDLRYGVRMVRKHPGFTTVAVLTLALGIGANTAIFSLVNATLLRPLPYPNSDQIVMVWGANPGGFGRRGKTGFSALNFLDYQAQNQVFAHLATFNDADFTLTGVDNPERIRGGRVTAEFFSVLAVKPLLGRTFLPAEEQAGQDRVVVLSYGLWQRRFGSDPQIVGQAIRLDATSYYTVVGVLPQSFDFSIPEFFSSKELWIPAVIPRHERRGSKYLSVIARLKPGVTLRQAQGELDAITNRLTPEYGSEMGGFGTKLARRQAQISPSAVLRW